MRPGLLPWPALQSGLPASHLFLPHRHPRPQTSTGLLQLPVGLPAAARRGTHGRHDPRFRECTPATCARTIWPTGYFPPSFKVLRRQTSHPGTPGNVLGNQPCPAGCRVCPSPRESGGLPLHTLLPAESPAVLPAAFHGAPGERKAPRPSARLPRSFALSPWAGPSKEGPVPVPQPPALACKRGNRGPLRWGRDTKS